MSDRETTSIYPKVSKPSPVQKQWPACLVVLQGNKIGNKFLLEKDRLYIGRSNEMDICLEECEASRKHAVILRHNDSYILIDQNSKNGTWINSKKIASAVLYDNDLITIGSTVFKFLDANSSEQAYYDEIYRQTFMDQVLQVFNKHYFLDQLELEIERCRRYGSEVALLLLDADNFKQLNDTYGHLAGDAALLHIVNVVKNTIRKIDLLCRYGGEEFTIILPNTDRIRASVVAEHIRNLIADTAFHYHACSIKMSVSIGVASFAADSSPSCNGMQLIERADRALYIAKNGGRNKVIVAGDGATK